jgi:hypothetical protein
MVKKIGYPDSFCGRPFLHDGKKRKGKDDKNDETCMYHSGYFKSKGKKATDGVWTCCGSDDLNCEPCIKEAH